MGSPETLWFAAPGLAHQLGNALFTLHGRARLLPAAGEPMRADDRMALLEGAERARSCLMVLRWLLDDKAEPQPAAATLLQVAEVLRVPLRDRGLTLELEVAGPGDSGDGGGVRIASGPVARLVVAVCGRLSALAVPGPGGTLRIGLQQQPAGVDLGFGLLPTPGGLPFPVDQDLVLEPLTEELRLAGAAPRPPVPPADVLLRIPAGPWA